VLVAEPASNPSWNCGPLFRSHFYLLSCRASLFSRVELLGSGLGSKSPRMDSSRQRTCTSRATTRDTRIARAASSGVALPLGYRLGYHGVTMITMGLPWGCLGVALGLPWGYYWVSTGLPWGYLRVTDMPPPGYLRVTYMLHSLWMSGGVLARNRHTQRCGSELPRKIQNQPTSDNERWVAYASQRRPAVVAGWAACRK
jgi:hypothetical protein